MNGLIYLVLAYVVASRILRYKLLLGTILSMYAVVVGPSWALHTIHEKPFHPCE